MTVARVATQPGVPPARALAALRGWPCCSLFVRHRRSCWRRCANVSTLLWLTLSRRLPSPPFQRELYKGNSRPLHQCNPFARFFSRTGLSQNFPLFLVLRDFSTSDII